MASIPTKPGWYWAKIDMYGPDRIVVEASVICEEITVLACGVEGTWTEDEVLEWGPRIRPDDVPNGRFREAVAAANEMSLRAQAAEARVAELEQELAEVRESAQMACENPCGDCAGCLYADDAHGGKTGGGDDCKEDFRRG